MCVCVCVCVHWGISQAKTSFKNKLNMGLLRWASVEKTVHKVEIHWLSGKEKLSGAAVC